MKTSVARIKCSSLYGIAHTCGVTLCSMVSRSVKLRRLARVLLLLAFVAVLIPPAFICAADISAPTVLPLDTNNSALAVMACFFFCATLIAVKIIEVKGREQQREQKPENVALTNVEGYKALSENVDKLRETVNGLSNSLSEFRGSITAKYDSLKSDINDMKESVRENNNRFSEITAYVRERKNNL